MEGYTDSYGAQGFTPIALFSENLDGEPPTASDLVEWTEYYDLSYPVLSDPGRSQDALYDPNLDSRPTQVLISREGLVRAIGRDLETSEIEAVLAE